MVLLHEPARHDLERVVAEMTLTVTSLRAAVTCHAETLSAPLAQELDAVLTAQTEWLKPLEALSRRPTSPSSLDAVDCRE